MQDMFFEMRALERIELITRLVSVNNSETSDKAIVVDWVAELASTLLLDLKKLEHKENMTLRIKD